MLGFYFCISTNIYFLGENNSTKNKNKTIFSNNIVGLSYSSLRRNMNTTVYMLKLINKLKWINILNWKNKLKCMNQFNKITKLKWIN